MSSQLPRAAGLRPGPLAVCHLAPRTCPPAWLADACACHSVLFMALIVACCAGVCTWTCAVLLPWVLRHRLVCGNPPLSRAPTPDTQPVLLCTPPPCPLQERVNIVINYDMPETDERHGNGADTYLHRVGRAGRFGTKGLAITFMSSEADAKVLSAVQERFDVDIKPLPATIDTSTYMNAS